MITLFFDINLNPDLIDEFESDLLDSDIDFIDYLI